jgi:hypothetical protein
MLFSFPPLAVVPEVGPHLDDAGSVGLPVLWSFLDLQGRRVLAGSEVELGEGGVVVYEWAVLLVDLGLHAIDDLPLVEEVLVLAGDD